MCLNKESIFTEIYLPKSKPFIVDILYRHPGKIDFVNHIDQVFSSEYNTLATQECYFLRDFILYSVKANKSSAKIANIAYKEMPPLTKKYLEFCFSHSLEQIITSSTRTTDRTATLIDHVLTKSPHKISEAGVTA